MICAYVGDSIAVGLHQLDPKCELHAKVGASSGFIAKHFSVKGKKDYVIISMGSNDPYNPNNMENARNLRDSIKDAMVLWILPYNRTAANEIEIVARDYGDMWIDLSPYKSRDNVHPTYGPVSKKVKQFLNVIQK